MAEVRISALRKSFGATSILRGVDLAVPSGALFAILGASGSGKTTLLRLLSGFERVDSGTIEIDGRKVSGPGFQLPPEKRQVGYVTQEGSLFPHLSVAANVVFGLPRRERRDRFRAEAILESVGLPASYASRGPHELSGGEQQRVALARALAPQPKLVLLDEPFSALDASLRIETRQAVAAILQAAGATALLVTHDQSEALSMGREVAVLRDGVLAQVAPPEDLYRQPADAALAQFVGEAALLPGVIAAGFATCALGRLELARAAPDGPADVMVRPEQIQFEFARQSWRDPGEGSRRHLLRPRRQHRGRAGRGRRAARGARRRPHGARAGRPGVAQRRRPGDGLSAPGSAPAGREPRPGAGRQTPNASEARLRPNRQGKTDMSRHRDMVLRDSRRALALGAWVALAVATPQAAAPATPPASFLDGIHRQTVLTSTVPDNGDQNPYAIVVAPVSAGSFQKDDVLITNFNNAGNLQGLGATIVNYNPTTKKLTTFAALPRDLAGCPGGVGLSTALAVLKSGWVIVGSAPSADGTTGTRGAGCLIVLDANGKVAGTIAGDKIDMPWGNMAVIDNGDTATLFVSNAGFGVGSPDGDPRVVNQATVLRIKLSIPEGKPPAVVDQTVVGSGFGSQPNKDVFLIGPTGLALGPNDTLYVSDATGNRISAIWDATTRDHSAGVGRTVTKDGLLQTPLALATAPNGHLLVVNAKNGQVVEIDPVSGDQIKARWIDPNKAQKPPGSGDLFGIAMTPAGDGFYFVKDEDNTLAIAK